MPEMFVSILERQVKRALNVPGKKAPEPCGLDLGKSDKFPQSKSNAVQVISRLPAWHRSSIMLPRWQASGK